MNTLHDESRALTRLKLALLIAGILCAASLLLATSLSDDPEACGKKIYGEGVDCQGREIKAHLGDIELSGKAAACASCHGADGRGRAESGTDPGDITWQHLSLAYGHNHANGRKHPAFTEESFAQAVTAGSDPGGNLLSPVMPRFEMSSQDLKNLFAYTQHISTDFDPGVEDRALTIGTIAPDSDAGNAVKAVLFAYFDDLNQRGGIYDRKIVLRLNDLRDGNGDQERAKQLPQAPIFALLSPFTPGAEVELARIADAQKLPVIGPLSLPAIDSNRQSAWFYLSPGLADLAAELVYMAVEQHGATSNSSAFVFGSEDKRVSLSPTVEAAWKKMGAIPHEYLDPHSPITAKAQAEKLRSQHIDSIFFIGQGDNALAWMKAAHAAGWHPRVFLIGPLMGSEVFEAPSEFQGRIFAIYPALALKPDASAQFEAFSQRHNLPALHRLLQISAYCAAEVFEEALIRTGRDVTRTKLVHTLEQLHDFQTGLLPTITFGPNRHVGFTQSDLACADLKSKSMQKECGIN